MNMSIDEAIMTARIVGAVPNTLRLYRWMPSAVSIGYFQDIRNEVNLEACRAHEVDVVRRPTGGGAVYHDSEGEVTYGIAVDEKSLGAPDATSMYRVLCGGLIHALNILGVEANFDSGSPRRCPNILVSGQKISGSAQLRRRGVTLQHGTVLIDLDLEKMFTFLRVPWAKSINEIIKIASKKHTSIHLAVDSEVSVDEVCEALIQGFEEALQTRFAKEDLTPYEIETALKLYRKYRSDEWNMHRGLRREKTGT